MYSTLRLDASLVRDVLAAQSTETAGSLPYVKNLHDPFRPNGPEGKAIISIQPTARDCRGEGVRFVCC